MSSATALSPVPPPKASVLTRYFDDTATAPAPPPKTTASELLRSFYVDGYCKVPDALSSSCVASFVASLSDDLESQGVKLSDSNTWPKGNKNRVVESAPTGEAKFWSELLASKPLAEALDEILGGGCWELNSNPLLGTPGPRHWYCPVTFPEQESEVRGV